MLKIRFWYQTLKNYDFFRKRQKTSLFGKKKSGKPTKYFFELKMLKLNENV